MREQIYQKTNKSLSGGLRAVIVISLVVIGAMNSQEYQTNYQSIENSTNASVSELLGRTSGDLVIEDVGFAKGEFGNKTLAGVLQNKGGREYSYVQIQFNLYDGEGAQIGSTLANVNNVEPNGTWKFEATILQNDARMFKVKDITGF